jgi:uncharacterized protein (TIGR01370 family)
MKHKKNVGTRLIVCYMSIGKAEDYRYYWQSEWNSSKPVWLVNKNSPHSKRLLTCSGDILPFPS